MLVRLSEKLIPEFTAACGYEHVFGSKILTSFRAYGLENEEHLFFVELESRKPVAAVYIGHGVMTISANGQVDPQMMMRTGRMAGIKEVNADRELCLKLQEIMGGELESSWFMVYQGGLIAADDPDIMPGDLREMFGVLQRSHEYYRQHYTYDTWSADIKEKLAKGLVEIYQLVQDGQVVGVGSIGSQDDECGIVGSVAVVPEYRHQGLGMRISAFLTGRVLEMGKTPRLMPGYDEVAELYRKVGYVECGNWGELNL